MPSLAPDCRWSSNAYVNERLSVAEYNRISEQLQRSSYSASLCPAARFHWILFSSLVHSHNVGSWEYRGSDLSRKRGRCQNKIPDPHGSLMVPAWRADFRRVAVEALVESIIIRRNYSKGNLSRSTCSLIGSLDLEPIDTECDFSCISISHLHSA